MVDAQRLRTACEQYLAAVPIPSPFNLREFCDAVASFRDRPIRLFESPGPFTADHPSGAWCPMHDDDRIYIATGLAPAHGAQIVLHEIGHMMWGHDPTVVFTDAESVKAITPELAPVTLRRMLFRTTYAQRKEREAEAYASLVMERAGMDPAAARTARHGELVSRLAESLGHPVRRTGGQHG